MRGFHLFGVRMEKNCVARAPSDRMHPRESTGLQAGKSPSTPLVILRQRLLRFPRRSRHEGSMYPRFRVAPPLSQAAEKLGYARVLGRARVYSCQYVLYFCHSEAASAAEESAFLSFSATCGRRALSSPASFSGWIPGGDKTGDPNWYDKFVPIADDLFDQHLRGLKKEPEKRHRKEPTNRREGVTYGQEFQDSAGEKREIRDCEREKRAAGARGARGGGWGRAPPPLPKKSAKGPAPPPPLCPAYTWPWPPVVLTGT